MTEVTDLSCREDRSGYSKVRSAQEPISNRVAGDAACQEVDDTGSAESSGGGTFEAHAAIDCLKREAHCAHEGLSSCTGE